MVGHQPLVPPPAHPQPGHCQTMLPQLLPRVAEEEHFPVVCRKNGLLHPVEVDVVHQRGCVRRGLVRRGPPGQPGPARALKSLQRPHEAGYQEVGAAIVEEVGHTGGRVDARTGFCCPLEVDVRRTLALPWQPALVRGAHPAPRPPAVQGRRPL